MHAKHGPASAGPLGKSRGGFPNSLQVQLVCAFDHDGLDQVALAQRMHHIQPLDGVAEDRVAAIQERLRSKAQVELRAGGVGHLAARHRKRAILVLVVRVRVVFVLDGIAGTAGAGHAGGAHLACRDIFLAHIARVRAAALYDEVRNVAMELQAVVEALLGQFDEIAHMDRGILTMQLHFDNALVGGDDGDFVAIGLIFGGIHILLRLLYRGLHLPCPMISVWRA